MSTLSLKFRLSNVAGVVLELESLCRSLSVNGVLGALRDGEFCAALKPALSSCIVLFGEPVAEPAFFCDFEGDI